MASFQSLNIDIGLMFKTVKTATVKSDDRKKNVKNTEKRETTTTTGAVVVKNHDVYKLL